MDHLNQLIPTSGTHSVKEAVITLFLQNSLPSPDHFEPIQSTLGYDRFQFLDYVEFQVSHKDGQVTSKPLKRSKKVGFKMFKVTDGQIQHVIQGKNNLDNTILSFHTLLYTRWVDFIDHYQQSARHLFKIINKNSIEAISLHYIDEFSWKGENIIPQHLIFKKKNEVLPEDFYDSINSQFLTTTETESGVFNRLEVRVNSKSVNKTLLISHNITQHLQEGRITSPSNRDILEGLNDAHVMNKSLLKRILKNKIQEKINLNG